MGSSNGTPAVAVTSKMAPPYWALLERQLLKAATDGCIEFYDRYFDERGYLKCVPRWGGNDGPDDAAENLLNWPMLHALGADDIILDLYRHGWEGHLSQYTEAKTVEVPLALDGMYYKEFPTMFDWFHHGEGLNAFILQGLSDPHDRALIQRARRFAGFYMGHDPQADNYDPQHLIIKSLFNGSRGPLLRQATALDWAGDPIEVEGRFDPNHKERNFQEMLDHFKDYTDVVGDHPLNLGATTLAFIAFALTGEDQYREWAVEYIDAWVERMEANGGIIPSNIGLDGTIGGAYDGKWWAGTYGWDFTVDVIPYTGERAHRGAQFQYRAGYGFGNALLLTGNREYVKRWREMYDKVNANSKVVDGQELYPHMYGTEEGEEGWYYYKPEKFAPSAQEVFYWIQDRSVLDYLPNKPRWVDYFDGNDPTYPIDALQEDLATIRDRMEEVRNDGASPDCTMSDDMNNKNPAITDALTRLMIGGIPTGRVGYPLHSYLRYFDPERRRAGVPEDVAALVDEISEDQVSVTLVNLDQSATRTVIVQGGAYAEHQITSVSDNGDQTSVDGSSFVVDLDPGCGSRLTIRMNRYANRPQMVMPWA
jgi:hypothetical protein